MSKDSKHPYRGSKKRRDRKSYHNKRAELERMMFEMRQNKVINIYAKDVSDDHTPTNFFVVAFNLRETMTFKEFEEKIFTGLRFLM